MAKIKREGDGLNRGDTQLLWKAGTLTAQTQPLGELQARTPGHPHQQVPLPNEGGSVLLMLWSRIHSLIQAFTHNKSIKMYEIELQATEKEQRYWSLENKGMDFHQLSKVLLQEKKKVQIGKKKKKEPKKSKPAAFLVKLSCKLNMTTLSHIFMDFSALQKGLQLGIHLPRRGTV